MFAAVYSFHPVRKLRSRPLLLSLTQKVTSEDRAVITSLPNWTHRVLPSFIHLNAGLFCYTTGWLFAGCVMHVKRTGRWWDAHDGMKLDLLTLTCIFSLWQPKRLSCKAELSAFCQLLSVHSTELLPRQQRTALTVFLLHTYTHTQTQRESQTHSQSEMLHMCDIYMVFLGQARRKGNMFAQVLYHVGLS